MIKDYYPMDIDRTYEFIWDECGYNDKTSVEEILYDLISNNYCKYINKQGKTAGKMCLKRIKQDKNEKKQHIYCHYHRYQEKICKINNCIKKCKRGYDLCNKHIKFKTKINELTNHDDVFYNSIYEKEETNLYNNIDIETNNIELDIFINIKLKGLYKICNDFMLQKYFFEHKSIFESFKNNPIIKYNEFSIFKYLYDLYNNFKNKIIIFLRKYKINATFICCLLLLIKELKEKKYPKDVVLYNNYKKYILNNNIYSYIYKEKNDKMYNYISYLYNTNFNNVFNVLLESNKNNQIIIYNNVFKKRLKKYIENKKKRIKQKRNKKDKNKKTLNIKYKNINVSILNNERLIEKIDCGRMEIKLWPMSFDYYKDFLNYNIKYFHCYYSDNINDKYVILFYKNEKSIINYKEITYKELYDLFIREFNKESIIKFIKYYYKNDDLLNL